MTIVMELARVLMEGGSAFAGSLMRSQWGDSVSQTSPSSFHRPMELSVFVTRWCVLSGRLSQSNESLLVSSTNGTKCFDSASQMSPSSFHRPMELSVVVARCCVPSGETQTV